MKVFADYAFEMSSKGLRREELGGVGKLGFVVGRHVCNLFLTWYHWCFLTMDDPRE